MDNNKQKVGLFVPCCIDQIAPQSALRAVRLLERLGYDCYYPDTQTCCGKELYLQGDKSSAKQLGEKMMEAYDDCRFVVSLSSGCTVYIQQHFPQLFHNTTFHNSYRQFVDKCLDISDFLTNVAHFEPTVPFPHRVAFMDHCTTRRDYRSLTSGGGRGLREEPRRLLASVPQLQLVEMGQDDVCCGLGGLFANDFTIIADSLTRRKADNALSAKAEYVTSTEPSCLMHLQSYAERNDIGIKCLNLIDILSPEEL